MHFRTFRLHCYLYNCCVIVTCSILLQHICCFGILPTHTILSDLSEFMLQYSLQNNNNIWIDPMRLLFQLLHSFTFSSNHSLNIRFVFLSNTCINDTNHCINAVRFILHTVYCDVILWLLNQFNNLFQHVLINENQISINFFEFTQTAEINS